MKKRKETKGQTDKVSNGKRKETKGQTDNDSNGKKERNKRTNRQNFR